jgi:Bacterial Ig-like domain (group 3)
MPSGARVGLLGRNRAVSAIGVLAAAFAILGAGPVASADATVSSVIANDQHSLKEGHGYATLGIGTFMGEPGAYWYSATITWGDGPPITADVYELSLDPGKFVVAVPASAQSPPFADEGISPISFVVSDASDQSANPSTIASAWVGESDSLKLGSGSLIAATAGKPFSGTVFTFTNTYSGKVGAESPATDFTATISWGDGTADSAGVVSGSGTSFTVTGSHTYATAGNFGISFGVGDDKPGGTAGFGSLGSSAHVVDPSSTSVSSSANPSVAGRSLVFNALVSHTSGTAVPTGSIAFSDGSIPLAMVALSGGTAGFSTSTLAAGDHTITASYSGDANYAPSSGATLETVAASSTGAPRISDETISPRAFVAERGAGSSARVRSKRGARVRFKLSEAATVTFTIQRKASGRKHGRNCVKQTSLHLTNKKCARVVVGTFARAGASGSNNFHFTGRANGRPLARGYYVLRLVATDAAGKTSKPMSRSFQIIG